MTRPLSLKLSGITDEHVLFNARLCAGGLVCALAVSVCARVHRGLLDLETWMNE